jgi:hypothetical protein
MKTAVFPTRPHTKWIVWGRVFLCEKSVRLLFFLLLPPCQ